ncbi:MAG: cyclase family protein [Planctomycetota bacterium]
MRLYDISPRITWRLKVWPGDTAPRREVLLDMRQGANINLTTLHATVHLGAHADAPSHYAIDGADIAARSLEYYLGPCQVVKVAVGKNERIGVAHLRTTIVERRVLFITGTYPDSTEFNEDFAAFEPALVDALHAKGVILMGIDTPSVDLFTSKDLASHKRFLAHDMAILEGLALAQVPEGRYELIALPLALEGFDASPVRAVLRSL